jgi:hypothetical protein
MKIKSIIGLILIFAIFIGSGIGLFIYASNNEFIAPNVGNGDSYNLADPDSEIWEKDLDDLFAYLKEKGLLVGNKVLLTDSFCSAAFAYNNIDFYYWDPNEDFTEEAQTAWDEVNEEGGFMLWGQTWISVSLNGPFAMNIRMMGTNRDEILEAFESYYQADVVTEE